MMLREYLRHSRSFGLVRPLLRSIARLRTSDRLDAARHYRETVLGGTLLIAPGNIDGQFEVSARSELANRVAVSGSYEPDVTAILKQLKLKSGMIVNVGANIGFYSVFLARAFPATTRVLAVEPNPEAFRLLIANIERNALGARIQAVQACIGDRDGEVELCIVNGMPEYSSIGSIIHPGVAKLAKSSVAVRVAPLAKLVGNEGVSLIFADTEGAEAIVFAGSKEILRRDKPLLFFECSNLLLSKFESSSRKLEQQLSDCGYIVRNGLCHRLSLRHPYEGEAIAIHRDALAD
jgi:FkbM family methyltransferase